MDNGPKDTLTGRIAEAGSDLMRESMFKNISRILVPTIIEASGGGFIVLVGDKMHACTTLQEAFNYAAAHAEKAFGTKVDPSFRDLPKIITDQEGILSRAKRMVTGSIAMVLVAALSAFPFGSGRGDYDEGNPNEHILSQGHGWREAARRRAILDDSERDGRAYQERTRGNPEVDVRKVPTESYVRSIEPSQQEDATRRRGVRPHQ